MGSTPTAGSMENPCIRHRKCDPNIIYLECDNCISWLKHEELMEAQRETNVLLNDLLEEIRHLNRTQENMGYKVEAIKDKF